MDGELVQPTVLSQPVFVDGGKFFLQGSNAQWLGLTENGSAALGDSVNPNPNAAVGNLLEQGTEDEAVRE